MTLLSWPESHGALTHFPVALIIASLAFEVAALLYRKTEWHTVSFWLLAGGVIMAIPSALTGYLTVRQVFHGLSHLPPITLHHIEGAVSTLILSSIALAWRIIERDQLSGTARRVTVLLVLLAASAVGFTGFLGGRMVFLGADGETAEEAAAERVPPSQTAAVLPQVDPKAVAAGQKLFRSKATGCMNCHQINRHGGSVGPDLTHEARRHADVPWQVAHLKDPGKVHTGSMMPSFAHLKPDELNALASYLATRK